MNEQLSINNFFSFLAAMMLSYQPVKSLATINVGVGQGLSAGKRILPIIDTQNKITLNENKKNLNLNEALINFDKVNFDIDIEGHIENPSLQKALEELGFHIEKLDILGVYEAHEFRFIKNK